jgi:hypothetical protein
VVSKFSLYILGEGGEKLCGDSQHNSIKEMRGETFIQSSCRKGDARTLCKVRDDGGSAKEGTWHWRCQ